MGIRVNAVAHGLHDTGLTHQYFIEEFEDVKAIGKLLPLRRLGTAEDPASTYVFLASDAARYITGTIVDVSGGMAGLQITAAFKPQNLDGRKKTFK